jgi:hypothetical protein
MTNSTDDPTTITLTRIPPPTGPPPLRESRVFRSRSHLPSGWEFKGRARETRVKSRALSRGKPGKVTRWRSGVTQLGSLGGGLTCGPAERAFASGALEGPSPQAK